jgi:hypothetical protein
MSPARAFTPPPERRAPLLAAPYGGEERPRGDGLERLSSELRRELQRLGTHPLREVRRLEHEALAGQSPATPAILIAGMALGMWSLLALVVGVVLLAARLIA